ncbi:hypothetical protein E2562_002099 [Oryza meyeriana var. granulata]|uniref:Uncharacterized protein n=1 Tax=Oryza meyeriana var. granulata TaxID=110450 RepID=A0A6G1EDN1_9ORYZ|nr:hypothetical protein E2562_002099 [Oryza meyeriana var. granulata]
MPRHRAQSPATAVPVHTARNRVAHALGESGAGRLDPLGTAAPDATSLYSTAGHRRGGGGRPCPRPPWDPVRLVPQDTATPVHGECVVTNSTLRLGVACLLRAATLSRTRLSSSFCCYDLAGLFTRALQFTLPVRRSLIARLPFITEGSPLQ